MKTHNFKRIILRFLLPVFVFMIVGCSAHQSFTRNAQYTNSNKVDSEKMSSSLTQNQKIQHQEYRIQVGDVLLVSVWRENDLREEVIVRPDGKISFPLAGDVPVAGATFADLKSEITNRLSEYVKDPEVFISLKKSGRRKIIVLGEVSHPGVYSVSGRKTILEAIALAQGFTNDAVPSSVIHVRGGFRKSEGTRLDLSHALKEADLSQNISLQSEDVVYVPKKFIADVNYYVRQIISPLAAGMWTLRQIEDLN